jgi:very-short-patch-repair endonuclease
MANAWARQLRKTMTPQEVKLWVHLRVLRSEGYHFPPASAAVGVHGRFRLPQG